MPGFLAVVLVLIGFCSSWLAMAADLKQRGKGFLIRHLMSFVFANIVAGVVMVLLSADSPAWWQWLLALIIVGGIFVQAIGGVPASLPTHEEAAPPRFDKRTAGKRREIHDRELAQLQAQRAAWDAEHKSKPSHAGLLDELRQLCRELTADGTLDDDEIHTLHRWLVQHQQVKRDDLAKLLANHLDDVLADGEISVLESLDVLDLVEALAQGKSFSDLKDWRALAPQIESAPPKVKRRPKKHSPSRVSSNRLDAIRFQYLNADGEFSDRCVVVRVLDDEYFQGICQSRRALRTFRLDRVVGNVTSEDTGEVADAFGWAQTVKALHKV